jgi:hypothetical protein
MFSGAKLFATQRISKVLHETSSLGDGGQSWELWKEA